MGMRFIFASKITLYIMCFIAVITLLKNIRKLHTTHLPPNTLVKKTVPGFKYLLLWTNPRTVPFIYMGEGQSAFISRKCPHINCIVTANKSLLSDYRLFDVIAFHGPQVIYMEDHELPDYRLPKQKYVFASIESSQNYALCTDIFNEYFNWTWTYRLDSEVRWGYIVIRDSEGNVVGPSKDMNWIQWQDMDPVSDKLKEQLKNKTKAVAWFVSNCISKSRREDFVLALKKYLQRFNIEIDVFGTCGQLKCPREKEDECNKMIERDYYFYLSFENAFSEDYVTEKLLIPLQNNAVPIVYGGADYSRFLPYGSYLNARELGVRNLGNRIYELINDPEQYVEYFQWKKYYSYHKMSESAETNEYCRMCALLNDDEMMKQISIYEDIQKWWNPSTTSC